MKRTAQYELSKDEVAKIVAEHFGFKDPKPYLRIEELTDRFDSPIGHSFVFTFHEPDDAQEKPKESP